MDTRVLRFAGYGGHWWYQPQVYKTYKGWWWFGLRKPKWVSVGCLWDGFPRCSQLDAQNYIDNLGKVEVVE